MEYTNIVIYAAKLAKVPASLLLAICVHETGLKNVVHYNDGGSHSYGICQVKKSTAKMLNHSGTKKELMIPKSNAIIAAKYLKYQLQRYNYDWCKSVAAYNGGSYHPSKIVPGKPRNLKYVRAVQKKLGNNYKDKLSCRYIMVEK